MAKFVIAYIGGDRPSSPQAAQEHYAKYKQWLSDLGSAVVSPANPFKDTHTIHPDGTASPGSSTRMSGYTIIEAPSLQGAIEAAQSCPFLDINGTLEVSEMVQMDTT